MMRTGAMSVFAAAALLVVGSGPAGAKPKPKPKPRTSRTVEFRYERPGGIKVGQWIEGGLLCVVSATDCRVIPLRKDERYFEITVVDDSGLPAAVFWSLNVSPSEISFGVDCSPVRLRVPAAVDPVSLLLGAGSNVPDCAVATSGKVTAKIRNFA